MADNKEYISLNEELLPPHRAVQIFAFLFPFLLSGTVLSLIWFFRGYSDVLELMSLSVLSFFGAGKFISFAPVIENFPGIDFNLNFGIWDLALMVSLMDTMTAVFVTYNLHYLLTVPKIGPKLQSIRKDCYYLLRSSPWMRGLAWMVVVLFVAFPISGTGAIAGAFLGLFMGLSRLSTVITIIIGGFLGSFGMAAGAFYVGKNAKNFIEKPAVSIALAAVLIGLIVWAGYELKRKIREQKHKEENQILIESAKKII